MNVVQRKGFATEVFWANYRHSVIARQPESVCSWLNRTPNPVSDKDSPGANIAVVNLRGLSGSDQQSLESISSAT
jgi:hypothetical protein